MAPNDAASSRRQSFSSISLAKEEAAIGAASTAAAKSNNNAKKKRTGLNRKRVWIPAIGVYLISVAAVGYGSYRVGWDLGADSSVQGSWGIHPINGYLTDIDGTRYNFNKEGVVESVIYASKVGSANINSLNGHAAASTGTGTPTWWPTTMTKRKREYAPRAQPTDIIPEIVEETIEVEGIPVKVIEEVEDGVSKVIEIVPSSDNSGSEDNDSGSDSDTPTVVVLEEESDSEPEVVEIVEASDDEASVTEEELVVEDESDSPELVEIEEITHSGSDSDSEPGTVVEVHDPVPDTVIVEDSEPELVLEETEVLDTSGSGSDSELAKRGINNENNNNNGGQGQQGRKKEGGPGYPPYAVGEEPHAYSGNGDRPITLGVPRLRQVSPHYTRHLLIPAGPLEDSVRPITHGGQRFVDGFKPVPTLLVKDAPIPEGGWVPEPSYYDADLFAYPTADPTPEAAPSPARPTKYGQKYQKEYERQQAEYEEWQRRQQKVAKPKTRDAAADEGKIQVHPPVGGEGQGQPAAVAAVVTPEENFEEDEEEEEYELVTLRVAKGAKGARVTPAPVLPHGL